MPTLPSKEKNIKKETDVMRGKRVKRLRSMAALTTSDLAGKADVSRVSLSYWENATKVGLSEQGARKIISAIQKEGIACSYEWLWDGKGSDPYFLKIQENHGQEYLASKIFSSTEKEIELFLSLNKDAVIVKIDTGKLWPFFEFNDIVAGKWQPVETLRTEGYCIININSINQVRWVKKIDNTTKTSNPISLSYSPHRQDESEEIEIKNVAPIIRIWR